MPDVSGPGGSTPSAHQNLPATAGLDGFEYRTVAEAGLEHESAEASLLAALAAVLPDQVPTAQRGLVSGVLGVCVPIASVSGPSWSSCSPATGSPCSWPRVRLAGPSSCSSRSG
jgi:hypothetical protein